MKLLRRLLAIVLPLVVTPALLAGANWLLTAADPVLFPAANSHTERGNDLWIKFDQNLEPSTVNSTTFVVHSGSRGRAPGVTSVDQGTAYFDGQWWRLPGEVVQATVTTGTQFIGGGGPVSPTVWSYRIGVAGGNGEFSGSGVSRVVGYVADVALGDLDGDGHLDVVFPTSNQGAMVWHNVGWDFTPGQVLTDADALGVALGDLDGDGDLDIFLGSSGIAGQAWLNQGDGTFVDTGQRLAADGVKTALGDLDGDGDLDAITTPYFNGANALWLNDGSGTFTAAGQGLGSWNEVVTIGDLDNDGDLDAVFGRATGSGGPATSAQVWLNNGSASFSPGFAFGTGFVLDLELGDLDGDGYLDLVVSNASAASQVWLNKGDGTFNAGPTLGTSPNLASSLGDLDGDDDLDVVLNGDGGTSAWLNSGLATFPVSRTFSPAGATVVAADLDRDDDLDLLLENYPYPEPRRHEVWTSDYVAHDIDLALTIVGPIEVTGDDSFWYRLKATNLGTDAFDDAELVVRTDFREARTGVEWVAEGGNTCLTNRCDLGATLEPGFEVTVTNYITFDAPALIANGDTAYDLRVISRLSTGWFDDSDYDNNEARLTVTIFDCGAGQRCGVAELWCNLVSENTLQRVTGFISQAISVTTELLAPFHLPDIYRLRDEIMAGTPQGQHYTDLYYTHDPEITDLLLADGDLRGLAIDALAAWSGNIKALIEGQGDGAVITADQVAAVDDFLTALSAAASPELQAVIAAERAALPPLADFIGLTVEDGRDIAVGHAAYLPIVMHP